MSEQIMNFGQIIKQKVPDELADQSKTQNHALIFPGLELVYACLLSNDMGVSNYHQCTIESRP